MRGQPIRLQNWQRFKKLNTYTYLQTFFNTINRTLITTKDGWKWAVDDGGDRNNSGRQYGNLSDSNGVTDQGFVYSFSSGGNGNTILTWYDSQPFTTGIRLNQLNDISFNIGNNNNNIETRVIIKVDDNGVDKWFTSRQHWVSQIGNAGDFETNAIKIETKLSQLTWSDLEFDGLIGSDSTGFVSYNSSNLPINIVTPQGILKGIGLWNLNPNNTASRFDDFSFKWVD